MIFYIWVFFETVEKIQVSFNSGKYIGRSVWRDVWMCDNISLNPSQDKEYFGQICIENENTYSVFNILFPKIVLFLR
jgi:hypothetical protein